MDQLITPTRLPGKLLGSLEDPFAGGVFYVDRGRRHWLSDAAYMPDYGWQWPDSVEWVSAAELQRYRPSSDVPRPWTRAARLNPPRNPTSLREIAACTLKATGLEFGPGANPLCVPLHCTVKFADFVPVSVLKHRKYDIQIGVGKELVDLDVIMNFQGMDAIADQSLDFVIACHLIEHIPSPLHALKSVHRVLKPGGELVLVVPDQRLTFDKTRALTPLEHLITDYEDYRRERDEQHYYDYFQNVLNYPDDVIDKTVATAMADYLDVHYHTWTYDTFGEVLDYVQRHVAPWSAVWTHPPGEGEMAIEFYCTLTK